jgi:hypothetical protein
MNRYFELIEIRNVDKVNFAASYLKKSAATWWMVEYQRAETAGQDLDWEVLAQRLQSRFKPRNADTAAREKLERLQQTGSVSAYSHAFRLLMQDLPDMHEGDRLHNYMRGLKEAVSLQVGLQGPLTVQEAEAMAETVDAILNTHRRMRLGKGSYSMPTLRPSRNPGGVTPMELDTIGRKALTDKDRDRLRKEGKCFYCREGKHLAKDCPDRRKKVGINHIKEEGSEEESGKEDSPAE